MKTDIKALTSFTCSDEDEAKRVQQKASDIVKLLEDGTTLTARRNDAAEGFGGSGSKYGGFSSEDYKESKVAKSPKGQDSDIKRSQWDAGDDDGFGAAFDSLRVPESAPTPEANAAPTPPAIPTSADLFDVSSPGPAETVDAPSTAGSLTGAIGKIQIKGVERERSTERRGGGGGVSLGKLPTPAVTALPAAVSATALPAVSAASDLLGLMDDAPTTAVAPAAG